MVHRLQKLAAFLSFFSVYFVEKSESGKRRNGNQEVQLEKAYQTETVHSALLSFVAG